MKRREKQSKGNGPEYINGVQILLAAVLVYVLNCKIQGFEVSDSAEVIDFFRNLSTSFTSANLADLFEWTAIYLMIHYVWDSDNAIDKWSLLLAAPFSVSYVVASSFSAYNSPAFLTDNWYQVFISGFCIAGFLVLFYFCIRLILIFVAQHVCTFVVARGRAASLEKHYVAISFLIILGCWLPWIIMNYPGTFCYDSNLQIRQFFGDAPFTAHHPPLSTYIMGVLMVIGRFFADVNLGFFLYILLQTCLGTWIFSFGIGKLHAAGIRLRYCLIMTLFYGLSPMWGCFVQWYEKDLLYAEIATLFLIFLIDTVVKRECTMKDAIALLATGVLASLLRNNGVYAVIPALMTLVFYVGKRFRKAAWLSLIGTLLIYVCCVNLVYPYLLGIENGSIREVLSLPFQQTARYVAEHDDDVTEYEKNAIDGVLEYASLAESYNAVLSDPVKELYKDNEEGLQEYFNAWGSMLWKHPETYMSALLNASYGYMAPVKPNIEPRIWTYFGDEFFLTGIGLHRVFGELPTSIYVNIREFALNAPLVRYLAMPGMYTWIVMLCTVIFLKKRQYGPLIIMIPEFVNILVCIASPMSNGIRYELPVVAAAPLLVGWTFLLAFDQADLRQLTKQAPHHSKRIGNRKK